jgi:beta-mannosidase
VTDRSWGHDAGSVPFAWRAAVADEDRRRHYPDPAFDDGGWDELPGPGHWRSVPAFADTDGPLLYRARFASALDDEPGARAWLRLDGVMYTSDVWLDGAYLGDTEGYFFPHSFEVTEQLGERDEHVLALEVACPRPTDLTAKRALTGVFQHWDQLDQTWNPGGIWWPPALARSGPVRIKHFRVVCREATEASAVVFVRAVLDAAAAGEAELVTTLDDEDGAARVAESRDRQPLAAGENRVEWTLRVDRPRRWWPWSLGDQPLHRLRCEVRVDDRVSDARTRRVGLRSISVDNWIFSVNGERLFLKGANQGPARLALAEASDELLAGDIHRARDAGLDFVRLHAHVSRPATYDTADEAGLLLWQDLPLQWGYARSVRRAARRQAREAVDLLGHHPSVFVWCGHNEPFAIDVTPDALVDPSRRARIVAKGALSTVLPTWNKTVLDHSIKRALDRSDGSRPVIPHSGVFPHLPKLDGTDTHVYFGWYQGTFRQFGRFVSAWPRVARFVSEFGAQAVPDEAPFLHPERWPDLDWEEAHERYALQKPFFDEHVPPAAHETFAGWVAATQRYQADVIRYHVETLRRIKYRPCGGFAQFSLADGYPSVTWAVLDADRRPKLAFPALQAACQPVVVVADWLPDPLVPGQSFALDVHVVNDTRITFNDMIAVAHLSWREYRDDMDPLAARPAIEEVSQDDGAGKDRARPAGAGAHRWTWTGAVPADDVVRVGTIQATAPPHPAALRLELSLSGPEIGTIGNRYDAIVRETRP